MSILENINEIEFREENLNILIQKRDKLLMELQSISSNLPVIIENNKKELIFKTNNNEYLEKYHDEMDKIEKEYNSLILNLKSSLKEEVDKLYFTEKYKILKKEKNLTKEELLNIIYEELIIIKMSEVDFVN
jgi:hypothetical protein